MNDDFRDYNRCLFNSVKNNPKVKDFGNKKSELINEVLSYYNLNKHELSVLFVGFNPAILVCDFANVTVTCVSDEAVAWLQDHNSNISHISEEDVIGNRKWDVVVIVDEYFTFASDDEEQKVAIAKICGLANEVIISTLKDYKNLDFKEKEFSQPAVLRIGDKFNIFTEFHDWDFKDRSCWKTYLHVNGADTLSYGPYNRKTMYFKQLAKFSIDAGAASFLVHKNLMFKGLIKKNYENVVSIRFNDEYR